MKDLKEVKKRKEGIERGEREVVSHEDVMEEAGLED
jgi:hypothetical protein